MYSLCLIVPLLIVSSAIAQNVSRKHISDRHQHYYDSLLNMNYDRVFPVFGKKVYKKGFDIPFPFGIMINGFGGRQGITISNISIGIKGPDGSAGPVNLDSIVEFQNVKSKIYNLNLRGDLWLFPFLNIYGLISYMPNVKTHVELSKPIHLTSEPEQDGWAWGAGIMGAFGLGPVWLQMDYDFSIAEMELLENKVLTQVAGLRIGHVFTGRRRADKNVSVWIGMMGIFLNNDTEGEIPLSKVFPDISSETIDKARQNYNSNSSLTPAQKNVLDKITDKLSDRINSLPVDEIYITYQMDKAPASRWAGLAGLQYQFNKRWQLRSECNFISSSRFSVMASLNYRFLGFKKKSSN